MIDMTKEDCLTVTLLFSQLTIMAVDFDLKFWPFVERYINKVKTDAMW